MRNHEIKSELLTGILQTGMVEEIMTKYNEAPADIDQIKAAIQEIADDNKWSSEFHRKMMEATK